MPDSSHTHFATVRDIEMAYIDIGSGPVVLALHGFPFDKSMWTDQVEALTGAGFRVVAPDLRGLGENKCANDINTMDDMARDVAMLMNELKIDTAVLCGLSMGCYVAFEFIHLFPSRVTAFVLAGGRCEGPDKAEKHSRQQQAKQVIERGFAPSVDSILQSLLAPATLNHKPDVVAHVHKMVKRTDPLGAAAAQRGMAARRDYCGDLADISVPVLIIAGREDGVRKPIDAQTIHRGINNSRLEIIANAGHLMNMEQPQKFNDLLASFLSGLAH